MPSMSSDDYVTVRQIGKGAFGTAHIVQHKVTGERFVLKRVRLARQSARERQSSVKELLLLSNLRHRNVLEFKGCWVEGGCNLCMLVELCESGDLLTQLRLRHPTSIHFTEDHLQEMAVQLLSALAYLHRSNIAHRDLKTANILITGEGCLKIADFGLSTVLESESNRLTKTMVGTPNYMSPCVLQEKPYGTPNDIWGLGCVLFELSALKPAFQAFNMAGLIKKVTAGAPPAVPSCYSEHWRNLVRAMLTKEPDMRPSAAEILELEWLQPAVRRVAARFGPELPPGAPDLLDRLVDLPADIMGLMDAFQAQEREEKRRADEARERRKAAVAKWDPLARAAAAAQAAAAAAAKQPKLPPLKPHVPRKPPPRVSRVAGGPGGPPRPVLPLHILAGADGAGGDGASSPNGVATGPGAAADKACPRRKTYCGEDAATAVGRGAVGYPPRRAPATLPGGLAGVLSPTAAARVSDGELGGRARSAAWLNLQPLNGLRGGRDPQASPGRGGQGAGGDNADGAAADGDVALTSRLRNHRPSSAPPDSPIRRTRRGGPEVDSRISGQGLDGTSPLGPHRSHRTSSCCGGDFTGDPRVVAGSAGPSGTAPCAGCSEGKPQDVRRRQARDGPDAAGPGPAKEDSEPTFRYLPPMRSTSGVSSRNDAGPGSDSGRSGGGGGECGRGGSDDGTLSTAVRHECSETALPRRGNSETVLSLTAAARPTGGTKAKVAHSTARARAAQPTAVAAAAAGEAGRSKAAGPSLTVPAAAAAGTSGAVGGRRPSETAISKTGGAAAAAAAAAAAGGSVKATAGPARSAAGGRGTRPASGQGTCGGGGGTGGVKPRVSSAGSRRASGTGYGYGGGGAAAAAANGGRRSTGTGASTLLGQQKGPTGANAAGGAAAGPGRSPPPAAILKRQPSAGLNPGSSRPTSAASRPSSARQQQQQPAVPAAAAAAKLKPQQRRG